MNITWNAVFLLILGTVFSIDTCGTVQTVRVMGWADTVSPSDSVLAIPFLLQIVTTGLFLATRRVWTAITAMVFAWSYPIILLLGGEFLWSVAILAVIPTMMVLHIPRWRFVSLGRIGNNPFPGPPFHGPEG